MMDTFLHQRLRALFRRQRMRRIGWELAAVWTGGILAGGLAFLLARSQGWAHTLVLQLLVALTAAAAVWILVRRFLEPPDYRSLALRVEKSDPELKGMILTAVQQTSDSDGRPANFLQQELLSAAIASGAKGHWRKLVPLWQIAASHVVQLMVLVGLVLVLIQVDRVLPRVAAERAAVATGLSVTPGNTEIERGETLVVLARFGGSVPGNVDLLVNESGKPEKRIPLVKSLSDPVFGGTLAEVSEDFRYRVAYGEEISPEYSVKVFEFPRLMRPDAELTFPAYTRLEPRRIEDTRRLSAVEGTLIGFTLQLNKPVVDARLVARDKEQTAIALLPSADKAVATLPSRIFPQSQTYDLRLTDSEGRTNKLPTPFVIEVQPNRRPELRLLSPRGDLRPSPLEEISFQGTVWDDFGSPSYGLAYSQGGGEMTVVELGKDAGAKERRSFSHLLRLEDLHLKPDALISWHVWADDIGPDGQRRRTTSDLYFGEVRPFDEIFREETGMQAENADSDQMGGMGNAQRLTELQKQIMSATWKLQRDASGKTYADDVKVVRDSQVQALGQAREASAQNPRPADAALWSNVAKAMESAASQLNEAVNEPSTLQAALSLEQNAYQDLLRLQQHETNVSRSRSRRGGQGGRGNQQQMDQLDLAQSENRYETQRQARSMQDPQRREQVQTINRLQELARRQEAVNERLKELQTALQEARTEEKREELRRELKRLQEEQRDMLADVDELRQRMDRPENQSRMAEERRQLENTRQDLQRSADATGEGSVSQALAAGTRAQRQLEEMKDSLRKENSSEFADDLRELRSEARELARQQQAIGEKLSELADGKKKSLSDQGDRENLAQELKAQRERMENLVKRATELSEQSENTEPLVSRQLYDSLRKVSQDDANVTKQMQQDLLAEGMMTRSLFERLKETQKREGGQTFDLTSELLREGYLPKARTAESKARAGVDELRRGVERAAGNVLGDDAEALRHAQRQLDELTESLTREAAKATEKAGRVAQADQTKEATDDRGQSPEGESGEASSRGSPEGGREAPGASPGREVAQSGDQPGTQSGGGRRGGFELNRIFDGRGIADPRGDFASNDSGPIMGDEYGPWANGLREVEDVLDDRNLRNAVATARERARRMRQDYRHDRKKPDWAVVRAEILNPLAEVRQRISEELSRRNMDDPLAPVDRDPVPARFAEPVRKYYEELGKNP
ncbi:MAG: hypothetical protein K1X42_09275 [Opitutaceae bacterium]|nr:hypothetical protein [Opitutaceae bacterium]